MRGAFYVMTALLVAAISRSAAEFDRIELSNPSDGDRGVFNGTTTKKELDRGSHKLHDGLTPSSDDEERTITADLIKQLETPLIKASMGSLEANSALLKAPQESASNWHPSAHPGSSTNIDGTLSRIGENSATGKAAWDLAEDSVRRWKLLGSSTSIDGTLSRNDEDSIVGKAAVEYVEAVIRKWNLPMHPGSSASIGGTISGNQEKAKAASDFVEATTQKWNQHPHPGADETARKRQHLGSIAAIDAPSHTLPTNEHMGLPLNDWRRGISNIHESPHVAEQLPNSQPEEADPTLTQHTADHHGIFQNGIPGLDDGPSQIVLPLDPAKLQEIVEVHEKFMESLNLPCTQTLKETKKMLYYYNWMPMKFKTKKTFTKTCTIMTAKMTVQDLVSVLTRDIKKLDEPTNWALFEDYRKLLREARDYGSKLSEGAALEDELYLKMLRKAYLKKSNVMYETLKAFCAVHSPLCSTNRKLSQPKK